MCLHPTPAAFSWVVDLTPPAITVKASVTELWPPNGRLVPDTITGSVTDTLGGVDPRTVSFRVIDEYGRVQPAGSISPGADGAYSFVLALESARSGDDRDGRRYEVVVTATDVAGNSRSVSILVIVPHDGGK